MDFYDEIADAYDNMTRFRERVHRETNVLNRWLNRYAFKNALDVACGTGIHTVALAKLGVKVTGVDISAVMLERAKTHAEEFNVDIEWVCASMQQLGRQIGGPYQSIFCLGNSIPHLLKQIDLERTARNFFEMLETDGVLVLQLLNYHRILAEQDRIVNIQRQGATEYIRFYDFYPNQIIFNLLTITCEGRDCCHTLHSTALYPYQRIELEHTLLQAGFADLQYYGDMLFQPFEEHVSHNLVIVAR